ncbi:hypothetical protein K443DRAFT_609386 [Laccaria amethystina LaAM-08-1]|uniref:Uncharacterized protein n=1 Tax=Laccaria amethystina LaAM-08-1 TaxID=1095629 RepID=A0A0C9XT03_9AGAR|nr:hypothetical protein K443DRAFT_609386 [Laccaria amethystina LaAM-08-1]
MGSWETPPTAIAHLVNNKIANEPTLLAIYNAIKVQHIDHGSNAQASSCCVVGVLCTALRSDNIRLAHRVSIFSRNEVSFRNRHQRSIKGGGYYTCSGYMPVPFLMSSIVCGMHVSADVFLRQSIKHCLMPGLKIYEPPEKASEVNRCLISFPLVCGGSY